MNEITEITEEMVKEGMRIKGELYKKRLIVAPPIYDYCREMLKVEYEIIREHVPLDSQGYFADNADAKADLFNFCESLCLDDRIDDGVAMLISATCALIAQNQENAVPAARDLINKSGIFEEREEEGSL
jgi:hypothetical protein